MSLRQIAVVTRIAIPCFFLFAMAQTANAQLGQSIQDFKQTYLLQDAGTELDDEFLLSMLDDAEKTSFKFFRATPRSGKGPKLLVCFDDEKAVGIRPHKYSELKLADVVEGLSYFSTQAKSKLDARWARAPAFGPAFPPVGKNASDISSLRKAIGRSKIITYNARTGEKLGESAWSDITVPTRHLIWSKSSQSHNVDVFVSGAAQRYALVSTSSFYSSVGDRVRSSSTNRVTVGDFMICDARFFWQYVSQSIAFGFAPGNYEGNFKLFVPKELHEQARIHRLAVAYLGMVETSELPMDELARLGDLALKTAKKLVFSRNPNAGKPEAVDYRGLFRQSLFDRLAKRIAKQSPGAQIRRMQALSRSYGSQSINVLVPMIRRPGSIGTEAKRLLRQIASQHKLSAPPSADAQMTAWTAWARRVEPGKE